MAKESAEILKKLSEHTLSKEVGAIFDAAFENLMEGKPNSGLEERVRQAGASADVQALARRLEQA